MQEYAPVLGRMRIIDAATERLDAKADDETGPDSPEPLDPPESPEPLGAGDVDSPATSEETEALVAVDYPIKGPPSISLTAFRNILVGANSPAAPEAIGIYDAAIEAGVDPAVLLAVFQHESSFGTTGVAVGRNNGFGSRFYASVTSFGGRNAGGWAAFDSWTESARYTAHLLAGALYAGSGSYSTARTFPYRYAPSADGNAPASYGNALVRSITQWTGGKGAVTVAAPKRAAPTVARTAAHPAAAIPMPQVPKAAAPVDLAATLGLTPDAVMILTLAAVGVAVLVLILTAGGGGSSEGTE